MLAWFDQHFTPPAVTDGEDASPLPKEAPSLTMLTFNAGLLRVNILSLLTVYSYPQYSDERIQYMPSALLYNPADILAIQECYDEEHFEFLQKYLVHIYPHHARVESGDFLKFHNGLILFSRYPILNCQLQPYEKVSRLEYFMATKSSLIVDVDVPFLGIVTFVNVHTTSGGTADPHHHTVDQDREDELRQAVEACTVAANEGKIPIIIGDLNCGPDLSSENFNYLLKRGFRDTYAEAEARNTVVEGSRYTWDPLNELNVNGPHSHTPLQRMDHIMLSQKGLEKWVVDKFEVLFTEKIVDIKRENKVTLSDHYGVLVKIVKKV